MLKRYALSCKLSSTGEKHQPRRELEGMTML